MTKDKSINPPESRKRNWYGDEIPVMTQEGWDNFFEFIRRQSVRQVRYSS